MWCNAKGTELTARRSSCETGGRVGQMHLVMSKEPEVPLMFTFIPLLLQFVFASQNASLTH